MKKHPVLLVCGIVLGILQLVWMGFLVYSIANGQTNVISKVYEEVTNSALWERYEYKTSDGETGRAMICGEKQGRPYCSDGRRYIYNIAEYSW